MTTAIAMPMYRIIGVSSGGGEGVGEGDTVGEGLGEGLVSGVGVGSAVGVGLEVGVGMGVGVGVGDDDGYVVIVDHPLYPWTLHEARARTEYVLVLEPRLYSTVKVVVL